MIILAIDPGYHNGIIVLEDGQVALHHTVTVKWRMVLKAVIARYPPNAVVIERAPSRVDSPEQGGRVLATIEYCTSNVPDTTPFIVIAPGDYKPIAKAQEWRKEVKLDTPHEYDAYCMARWYWTFHVPNPFADKEKGK